MALDTGAFIDENAPGAQSQHRPAGRVRPTLDPNLPIGAALKLARQAEGLSVEDIAAITRVGAGHLRAIEAGAMHQLPSRPFAIGYVRAYAKAMALDGDAVVARFRIEHADPDSDLHSPVGVAHEGARRSRVLGLLVALVITSIVGWNVVRHAMAAPVAKSQPAANHGSVKHASGPATPGGPYNLSAPLPAPPEATTPEPYVTPGLAAASANGGSADAANAAAKAAAAKTPVAAAAAQPTAFIAQGNIYGAAANASSGVILQARKTISLEVRGAGGAVYAARQLAAGEAYRLPAVAGLSVEVSNPAETEVFVRGISHGLMPQAVTPVSKFTG